LLKYPPFFAPHLERIALLFAIKNIFEMASILSLASMESIQSRVSLQPFNTFGVQASAGRYLPVFQEEELQDVLDTQPGPYWVLGGGSNILLTRDVDALVLHNRIRGIERVAEEPDSVLLRIGGGEVWHEVVRWTIQHDLGGLENLSLIPGSVGAAPIQNIGAYGAELSQVLEGVEAIELSAGELRVFDTEDCRLGYRLSRFKAEDKGKFFISRVYLRLQKPPHRLNLLYGALRQTLDELGLQQPSIRDVSEAVIRIRRSKLPDPSQLGNSGSFFKNPELEADFFASLQKRFPKIVHYPLSDGRVKVPAGWLIEQCGWKGYRQGDAGCYEKQALVLVNFGTASGGEIWSLAREIQASVETTFGIRLEPEVNVM